MNTDLIFSENWNEHSAIKKNNIIEEKRISRKNDGCMYDSCLDDYKREAKLRKVALRNFKPPIHESMLNQEMPKEGSD